MTYKRKRLQSSSTSKASRKIYRSQMVRTGAVQSIPAAVVESVFNGLDNDTMVEIKAELQGVMISGNWMRLAARIPVTANFLLMAFGVGQYVPVQITKAKKIEATNIENV